MNQKPRRQVAFVSIVGITQLHLRNPYIIAWWSAAFPGFGHMLLSKYLRGLLLIGWEMLINSQMHLNEAMVYTFIGQFEKAKEVMDINWMSLYAPVYLFSIYDSYRTAVDMNHQFILAKRENAPMDIFKINGMEINYLDKRSPWVSVIWSLLMPGMGQLFTQRIVNGFFVLANWIVISYLSHLLEGIQYLLMWDLPRSASVVKMGWLLFLPSIYGFAVYDAYVNTVEYNKLFDREQVRFLESQYQHRLFPFPKSPLLK
jgi:TM2 domain-containing membrane protein YozV